MRVAISIALAALFLRVSITFGAGLDNPLALRGIVFVKDPKLPEMKFALLDQGRGERSFLAEGQRNGAVEVVRISPELGKVTVHDGKTGQTQELFLKKPVELPAGSSMMQFESANMAEVVTLLQWFSGKTVISSPLVRSSSLTFTTTACNSRAEAAVALKGVFETNGLFLSPRGDKFDLLVADRKNPLFEAIADPPKSNEAPEKEVIPAGLIAFQEVDVLQFLQVYAALAGRTMIQSANLPASKITLKTQTAMPRHEAVWMLESALRLAGIAVVPEAKQFAFALRPEMTNGLPQFDRETAKAKARTTDGLPHLLSTNAIRLPNLPARVATMPNSAVTRRNQFDAAEFLQMYGALVGRESIPLPPGFSRLRFYLEGDRLDASEAVYALEALGWVNGVGFETIGANKVALTFLPSPKQ